MSSRKKAGLGEWVERDGLFECLQSQGFEPFPSRFSLFALLLFRGLFKKASLFDLPKKAFPLELAFKDFERFFEIITVDSNNQSALFLPLYVRIDRLVFSSWMTLSASRRANILTKKAKKSFDSGSVTSYRKDYRKNLNTGREKKEGSSRPSRNLYS